MANKNYRVKYVTTNAINMVTEINETLVTSAKQGRVAEITLPGLFDRAFMIFHESAVVPMYDWVEQYPKQ